MRRHIYIVLLLPLLFSSCSLFRFSIATGDRALSSSESSTRAAVKGYYSEFANEVTRAADSIIVISSNQEYKTRAVRWKINATSACVSAAFQTSPEVALINTWVLALQMNNLMQGSDDEQLFGKESHIARDVSTMLLYQIELQARRLMPVSKYSLFETFCRDYASNNPVQNMGFVKNSLLLQLIDYMEVNQSKVDMPVGLMSEVISDMSDRISVQSTQTVNELAWSVDLFKLSVEESGVQNEIAARADSLNRTFQDLTRLLSHSPELLDSISNSFSRELALRIADINRSVDNAFMQLDLQRDALTAFVSAERVAIIKQVEISANNVIKNSLSQLPGLISSVLIYFVLAVLVLFSVPFAIGWFLGRRFLRKPKSDK